MEWEEIACQLECARVDDEIAGQSELICRKYIAEVEAQNSSVDGTRGPSTSTDVIARLDSNSSNSNTRTPDANVSPSSLTSTAHNGEQSNRSAGDPLAAIGAPLELADGAQISTQTSTTSLGILCYALRY